MTGRPRGYEEGLGHWAEWGSAMISDCNGRQGVLAGRIGAVSGERMVGRAFPVQVMPGDSATCHQALDHVPTGAILVIDAGGVTDRAVWGEVLTVAAQQRGVRGLVVDGAVRDIAAIRRRGFPVFAAAICPAGPHKAGGGRWGTTISCAGAVVTDGDLIVADADGVVAVPWDRHEQVAVAVAVKIEQENNLVRHLENGGSSADYLGL